MHLVIFEGSRWSGFAPLSLSRPVFALASGAGSLLEKQIRHLKPQRLTLWVRPEMEDFCRDRILPHLKIPTQINRALDDEPALLVNGQTAPFSALDYPAHEAVAIDEGEVISHACLRRPGLGPQDVLTGSQRWLDLMALPHTMSQDRLAGSLWDLIHWNGESLVEDFASLQSQSSSKTPAGPFHLVEEERLWLGPDVKLAPGCVLDASKGPVMIGAGASVGANAVVSGPCWIGPRSRVRPLAQLREGCSIGSDCTVGGEILHSILLGCTNKSHEGFLGHSYLGKWVNLGSGTTTSNLKNTYGEIRARVGDHEVPTGRQFLGSLIGDHSKTAVLTRLSAGTYVGFCSMLAGSALAPRMLPSFSFVTDSGVEPYQMDKAIQVMRRVFARRDRDFTAADEQIMRYVAEVGPQIEKT
jgi:UDP-N-acetylglucosamine diphosphorylase / glucose-1-phosphate thymidylyltransferase / UDP-N-acetylgalactosamine diphosphorylase / glucosamine-1-phosphate N-acetyltransferase / galactosamine-1-phosphate N-acetyltransferase